MDSPAIKTVREALDKLELPYRRLEDGNGFRVAYPDSDPVMQGYAFVPVGQDRFIFHLEMEDRADRDLIPKVAEFITRANYGMRIGNFEMDYDRGAIRFKVSIDFNGAGLTQALVRNSILAAMSVVETYGGGLLDVLAGEKEPSQAIRDSQAAASQGFPEFDVS